MKKLLFFMLAGLLLCACSKDDKGNDGGTPPPAGLTFTEPLHDWSLTVEQVKSREKRTLTKSEPGANGLKLYYKGENQFVKEVEYFFVNEKLSSSEITFATPNEENYKQVLAIMKRIHGEPDRSATTETNLTYHYWKDIHLYYKYGYYEQSLSISYWD